MKPNKKIIAAIQTYYFNRYRLFDISPSKDVPYGYVAKLIPSRHWDKDADLKVISALALKQGFVRFTSVAGTFWLTYKTKKGNLVGITTNKTLFPDFQKVVDKK